MNVATETTAAPSSAGAASLWRRLWMNPSLNWACEISSAGVCIARGARSGAIEAASFAPLAAGAVEVSPLHENVLRPEEVRQALASCRQAVARSGAPASADAALVIPDQAARLFFLNFDSLPRRAAEAVRLVRWKLKKSVPFDIEASMVSYFVRRREAGWQMVAVVLPEAILRQYESLAESAGLKPRFVTLSTLASLGLMGGAEAAGDSVLVAKYSPPWFTTAIAHDRSVCLFRTVSVGENSSAEISLPQILEAIYPSVAYFQDNFGAPLERAYLCGLLDSLPDIAESLARELHLTTRPLLPETALPPIGWERLEGERHLAALLGVFRQRRRA